MEWKRKYVDYTQTSILFEFDSVEQARKAGRELSKAIWGKGALMKLDGFVQGLTNIDRFLAIGTDSSKEDMLKIINFVRDLDNVVEEDFSMGVSGPTGLNQGIPNGGPGKGVIPAPLFGKGKPMSREEQKKDKKNLKRALDVLDLYGMKVRKG